MRFADGPTQQHHREKYHDAPYDQFLDDWSAKDFNARRMVQLFAKAGAKYVVPVTKHHVGTFCSLSFRSLTREGWSHIVGRA
jgi:alpha-L-fucosidase